MIEKEETFFFLFSNKICNGIGLDQRIHELTIMTKKYFVDWLTTGFVCFFVLFCFSSNNDQMKIKNKRCIQKNLNKEWLCKQRVLRV